MVGVKLFDISINDYIIEVRDEIGYQAAGDF